MLLLYTHTTLLRNERSLYYSICHWYSLAICVLFLGCWINYDALNNAVTCMFPSFFYCLLFRLSSNVIFGLECAFFPFFAVVAFVSCQLVLFFFQYKNIHTLERLFLFSGTLDLRAVLSLLLSLLFFIAFRYFYARYLFLVHMFVSITQLNKKKTQKKNHANEEKRIETKTKDSCVGNVTKRLYDRAQHSD